jgi:hypothetical protein
MRKFLLILLLFSTTFSFSQQDTGLSKEYLSNNDSAFAKLQAAKDSAALSIEIRQREDGNIKAFLQIAEQAEKRRASEKRNAYLRIGIGVALLIVLIVGLRRKKAKK